MEMIIGEKVLKAQFLRTSGTSNKNRLITSHCIGVPELAKQS